MAELADGYSTTIVINGENLPLNLKLWEKTVTPVGVDGGGSIPITTMRNVNYRTFAPKYLITLTEMTFTAAYDPFMYSEAGTSPRFAGYINFNCLITINFPDGSSLTFYGYLDKIAPQENTDGNQPMLTCTIVPTNQNGAFLVNHLGFGFTAIGAEVAPTYVAGP